MAVVSIADANYRALISLKFFSNNVKLIQKFSNIIGNVFGCDSTIAWVRGGVPRQERYAWVNGEAPR